MLKNNMIIIIIIIFISIPCFATDYTQSTSTDCVSNRCIETIYSGIRFVNENGKWVKIEDAKSLMGNGFYVKYLNIDKSLNLIINDFNLTYISLNMQVDDRLKNISIPITVWARNESKQPNELTGVFKKDYIKALIINRTFISKDNVQNITIPFNIGDILEFGSNSTIIYLNESNGGNVADSYVDSYDETSNFGTNTLMYVAVGRIITDEGYVFISDRVWTMWNLSVVPSNAVISNANLSLYMLVAPGISRTYNAINTSNNWSEANITWDNQTVIQTLQQGISTGTASLVWKYWNVTNASLSSFNQTNKNMSIMIRDSSATSTVIYSSTFPTKEYTVDITKRPRLIITYSIPSADTCTYSSGSWYINCNDNCTLTNANNVTNNIYIYGSNGFVNFQANQLAHAFYFNATNNCYWYYNNYRWLY